VLGDHRLVKFLFDDIAPRFHAKASGFTRIINFGSRRGDGSKMVVWELTEIKKKEKKAHKKKKEAKPPIVGQPVEAAAEEVKEEKKTKTQLITQEKPPESKKPKKRFFGGLRNIFKKQRDSL
jgi:large subunit ribosomal protein L17